jgi:hypothetical protein
MKLLLFSIQRIVNDFGQLHFNLQLSQLTSINQKKKVL